MKACSEDGGIEALAGRSRMTGEESVVEESDMVVNSVCIYPATGFSWLSAVVEAICINEPLLGQYGPRSFCFNPKSRLPIGYSF